MKTEPTSSCQSRQTGSAPTENKLKFNVTLSDLVEQPTEVTNEKADLKMDSKEVAWPSTEATAGNKNLGLDCAQIANEAAQGVEQTAIEPGNGSPNNQATTASKRTWRSSTLSLMVKNKLSKDPETKEKVPEKMFQKVKRGSVSVERPSLFGTLGSRLHGVGNSVTVSTNTSGFVSGYHTVNDHHLSMTNEAEHVTPRADPFDIFQDAFMFAIVAECVCSDHSDSVISVSGDSDRSLNLKGILKNTEKVKMPKVPKPRWTPPATVPPVIDPESEQFKKFYDGDFYGHLLERMTEVTESWWIPLMAAFRADYKTFLYGSLWERIKRRMPLLFGKSPKTPAEVVKNLREVLIIVDKWNPPPTADNRHEDKKYAKALEEVSKNVMAIKGFIFGPDTAEPSSEHVVQVAQLAQEVYNANVLPMLVKMLPKFEFECKKDVASIFNNLLRRQIGTRSPTVEYLGARPEILIQLVQGYSRVEIALQCGQMLRESIRHDHLAKIILYSDVFYTFFHYVQSEVFDIASDAFSTFKDLTTRHKAICAEFLDNNYDVFFGQYQNLLNSKNYVTRRQSLKLLGELLLDRHNFNIMTKYISNPENLKLMMELLRDKSRNIQYEAFHVFKVFVANPNKPKPISDILNRNREKLVEFLGEFHNDRTDDEQFNDEKAYLIKQIQEMKASPKEPKKQKAKEGDQAEPTAELVSSTAGLSISGPSTAGPSTAGPSTSGPSTSGPSTSGPFTGGPSTSRPSTSGPSTSGPSTSASR